MTRTARLGAMAALVLALSVVGLTQNGNESGPPAGLWSGPSVWPPPPPGQPVTALNVRVAFAENERGGIVLRLEAEGVPGSHLVVGAVRPGSSRPVVLTTGVLDADGRWSFERALTTAQARALGPSEFVVGAR